MIPSLTIGFFFALLVYPVNPIVCGAIFLLYLLSILLLLSGFLSRIVITLPCFLLVVLISANLLQWFLDPNRFSPDWVLRAKAVQGYLYLALMVLIRPLVRKEKLPLGSVSISSLSFLFTGIPLIYSVVYAFSYTIGGANRASFLTEHNFELAFLMTILGLRQLFFSQSFVARALLWPTKSMHWLQGLSLAFFSRSLSGSLSLAIVFIGNWQSSKPALKSIVNSSNFFFLFKKKSLYPLLAVSTVILYLVINSVIFLRSGKVGADRSSYLFSLLNNYNFYDLVFGRGISSILPVDMSAQLLAQSNLQSQLDSFGNATSLLLHSAWLRVVADTGLVGMFIVVFAFLSLFNSLPVYVILIVLGPVFSSGFSVGGFFNPVASFILFLSIYLLACLPLSYVGTISRSSNPLKT